MAKIWDIPIAEVWTKVNFPALSFFTQKNKRIMTKCMICHVFFAAIHVTNKVRQKTFNAGYSEILPVQEVARWINNSASNDKKRTQTNRTNPDN